MTAPYFNPEGTIKALNLKERSGLFVGGLNLEGPPEGISENESPDMFNIHFTRQNSIKPRDFPAQKFILSGALAGFQIKNSYTFTDKNLVTWLVITDFVDVYITDNPSDMSVYIKIPIADGPLGAGADHPLNYGYTTRFTFLNGKLFGTNGIDPVWYYDIEALEFQFLNFANGHGASAAEDAPKGRYICTHNSRVILQNSTAQPSAIWQSQVQDETKFIHAITSVPLVFNPESGQGGMGIGVKSLQDTLVIYNTQSIDALLGYTDAEFTLENWCKDPQKGCANANSIQEYTSPDGRTCHIYLAQNGVFYKLLGKDAIIPIGKKLSKGLLNKVIQVYSYREILTKIHGAGTNKFEVGNVNGTPLSNSTAFFVPRGTNVNNEPDFFTGSLFTNIYGSGVVPNYNFAGGFTKWSYSNWFADNSSSYQVGTGYGWVVYGSTATFNTNSQSGWLSRCNAIEIAILDGHTNEVLGTFHKNGDGVFLLAPAMSTNTHVIDSATPGSYSYFTNTIDATSVADFLVKLKYRKVIYQYRFYRGAWEHKYIPNGTGGGIWVYLPHPDAGWTHVQTDPVYADGSQIAASFVTIPTNGDKEHSCYLHSAYGAATFNRTNTEYFYTDPISLNVSRWGAFDAQCPNLQLATIEYEYRINSGAWTSITPGVSINYAGIPTGTVQIEFRMRNYNYGTGYEQYYPNNFDFFSFYVYQNVVNLPPIDSDICSLIFNEKYYCAMGVVDMGNFYGHNNILWEYDEWAEGLPRWSRHDLWVDAMEVYAGNILFMNTDKGFVLDPNLHLITQANNLLYANGVNSYYKTKGFDFDQAETLKWFKYLTFDFKKLDPTLPLYWHIENWIDDKYAGTILNYLLDTPFAGLKVDGRTHKSRYGKSRKMTTLSGVLNPQYYFYADPTDPTDGEDLNIGFGNRMQFMYIFYITSGLITKLNYEVLNTTLHVELKDYAVLPVDKSNMKIVSNENA